VNIPTPAPGLRHPPGPRGVALVVTLMMMSVLVMMVVGLAGVMRNEQAAARNLTYQVIADQMADLGARVAMAAVLSNSTGSIGRPAASGPGWMCINGTAVGLFSSNASGPLKNVEEIGTNSLVLGLPDSSRGQLWVSWSNLLGPSGALVGRYAWWVDDEGTKVNLNAVGSNNTNIYLTLLTKFPISADYLFVDPATGQTNNTSSIRARALAGRSNSLPTTESLKDTNVITGLTGANGIDRTAYRRAKGHVTAWSSNVDLTPWGTPKVSVNQTNTNLAVAVADLVAALNTNALTNIFGANMTLARKYGGGLASSTNTNNHGDLVMQQIAANIMAAAGRPVILTNTGGRRGGGDFHSSNGSSSVLRHRNLMPHSVASHYRGPYLEQVRARVDYTITGQSNVAARLGLWVRVVNPYPNTFSNWSLTVQPRKFRFGLYNKNSNDFSTPVNVSGLNFGPPLGGFSTPADVGIRVWVGPQWEIQNPPGGTPWPLGSIFRANDFTSSARSRFDFITNIIVSYTLTGALPEELPPVVKESYVILDQVCLYEGTPDNPVNLRDWLTHDDLAQAGNFRTTLDFGQFDFSKTPGTGQGPVPILVASFQALTTNDFGADNSLGVRKIDPQARFPLCFWDTNLPSAQPSSMGRLKTGGWPATAQAWSRTVPMAQSTTNRLLSYLPPDPAPGVSDILDHPHFVAGYRPTNGIRSVAQLGAIHTGIPWRTLRLGPTPATELAQGPPDWILLDVFTATSPAASLPSINANGIPMAMAGGSLGVASNVNGTIPSRSWSLASAMASAGSPISRTDTNAFASNGVPLSLTNASAAYGNLGAVASNLTAVLTNPSGAGGWSTNSDWRNFRAGRAIYPANGLLLRGEILETRGVAEDANFGEDVVEGRLRSFMDLITTRSDTFSVWSVGQGLQVVTNRGNRTNIMGEVRKQTVFQRVPQTNSSGTPTNYQLKLLYTRNHLVE